ncbi:hypothetical protein TMatcc_004102 [Talaromyces marneffei ATCC 18224]|nr:uncharacterized protein EYB26_000922 [Talaromyces marneffei]KAE8556710.1 hypothetical protein EYB25_001413 [Talaromyces marneffei]QGA13274.1 hypothetical protein EYB26_000922 [Talaromyces marneffei]
MPPRPPPKQSTTDQIKALEKQLQTLETRHTLEAAHWRQCLLQERHAHQETLKQLQQHISTFSQFMNAMSQLNVQRKFSEVEDRLENLMDCQQRLFDKVVSVEDFGMMLEDRVVEVESHVERDVELVPRSNQNRKNDASEGGSCGCYLRGVKREVGSDDEIEPVSSNYKVARRE